MIMFMDDRLPARFWSKVDTSESGCWEWTASLNIGGYAKFSAGGKHGGWRYGHRVAYEALVAPVDRSLDLDHLCRNRKCVNPAHLEPVTRRENLLRGDTIVAKMAAKTHCSKGHEFTEENTYLT